MLSFVLLLGVFGVGVIVGGGGGVCIPESDVVTDVGVVVGEVAAVLADDVAVCDECVVGVPREVPEVTDACE